MRPRTRSAALAVPAPAGGLILQQISLRLGGRQVLDGVSLTAAERRIGIVGRNGSGKTTLARVMAGLIAPDDGRAEVCGIDVARDRRGALGAVGILFQNPDHQIIFPTVEEEIAFGLTQMGRSRAEAAAATRAMLDRFGKGHWAGAATHSLSQGQKQLVCLMAILVMEPGLIVLDEPFSGLDIATRMQLMRCLDAVEATVALITHDPEPLTGFDRVIWLEGGKVIGDGPPDQVLDRFGRQMRIWGGQDDLSDLPG
ncbi:energy-coupling factor ABC transporter ATP-binding protein [Antarcticimicrobium luteum]